MNATAGDVSKPDEAEIRRRVEELGPWFQHMNLGGVWTAPGHLLGDYSIVKRQRFAGVIPYDLRGKTVLDIGCNASFYSIEMNLRHPLLALDLIREHVAGELLVFQSMQRGHVGEPQPVPDDGEFSQDMSMFAREDFALMYFVEKNGCGDPTNWWIPNRAGAEAMLRSAGFTILSHPEEEVSLCRVNPREGTQR